MNLPNALTVGRIAAAPLVGLLPFVASWELRLLSFVLFIVVAVTDYYDGKLARSRDLVTNLGKLLDPLADKLLLLATFVPMYALQRPGGYPAWDTLGVGETTAWWGGEAGRFPFQLPGDVTVPLPLWVIGIVLGRELFMTLFRQFAAQRGVIIGAIGPAKWKTGFQWTWVGAAFFWFAASTAATRYDWLADPAWRAFAQFNGIVGTVAMVAAVALTVYSLAVYLRRYGWVVRSPR